MNNPIYTIGHSTHSEEKLIGLLVRHHVNAIADVRSQPYSRMNPQFNRELLKAALKRVGIAYVFLGRELGARSEDPNCYVNGKVQYDRLARTPLFQEGLNRLVHGASTHVVAMLCAEKDPLTCHRTILVARQLVARGVNVQHILGDGSLESHDDALTRLLGELGSKELELFRTRDDVVAEAYARRGDQVAYVDKSAASDDPVHRAAR